MPTANVVPRTTRAVVTHKGQGIAVKHIRTPKLGDNEVLVKVHSVALNPTDWKHMKFISPPGSVLGMDFTGEVVQLGQNMDPQNPFSIGDLVGGSVRGGIYPDKGAFCKFLKADTNILWKIPEGSVSMEEALTLGTCVMTSVQAMFHPDRLNMVEYPKQADPETWFFVYSGSSSVGQAAIQLAHLSGYKVVTTASPRHHQLMKNLGAEVVFDYRDPYWIQKIKEATDDSVHLALDCFSEGDSHINTVKLLGPGKGKVWALWYPVEPVTLRADEVQLDVNLLYTIFGHTWTMHGRTYDSDPSDAIQIRDFLRQKLPELVREKKLRPSAIKMWEGGLDAIADGLDYMIAGKVSGEKIVYNI